MMFAGLHVVDWLVVGGYMALILYIGSLYSHKAGKNMTGFFLSGRNLPWWLAGTSIAAGHFSASYPIKTVAMVREYGISHVWIQWYYIPATMIGAVFLAKLWRRAKIITSVELLRVRYSGGPVHFLTWFDSIYRGFFMKNFFIAMSFIALEKTIKVMLPESNPPLIIFGICIVALIYSVMSGLYAVVITDFIQLLFATLGCGVLVAVIYFKVGPPHELVAAVQALPGLENATQIIPRVPEAGSSVTAWLTYADFLVFVSVLWLFHASLTSGGGDPQRLMASKSEKDSMLMLVWSNIVERGMIFWLWIIIGLGSLVILGPDFDDQAAFPAMGINYLPMGLRGLFVASIFAALMSTVDTNINMSASYLVNDIYKNYFVKNQTQTHYVLAARWATAFCMLFAFILWWLLLSGTTILDNFKLITMLMSGGALVGFAQWFWWRVNAWSQLAGMLGSIVVSLMLRFILPANVAWFARHNLATDHYAIGMLITILFSAVFWVTVTFLTKPTDMERLKDFYTRVRPIGFWGPVKAELGDDDSFEVFKKADLATWVCAVAGVYGFVFGFGGLLLGRYVMGAAFLVVSVLSLVAMVKLVSRNRWWKHVEAPEEDE